MKKLNENDVELIKQLCTDLSIKEIADLNNRKSADIQNHIYRIGFKLRSRGRHRIILMALKKRLINLKNLNL